MEWKTLTSVQFFFIYIQNKCKNSQSDRVRKYFNSFVWCRKSTMLQTSDNVLWLCSLLSTKSIYSFSHHRSPGSSLHVMQNRILRPQSSNSGKHSMRHYIGNDSMKQSLIKIGRLDNMIRYCSAFNLDSKSILPSSIVWCGNHIVQRCLYRRIWISSNLQPHKSHYWTRQHLHLLLP